MFTGIIDHCGTVRRLEEKPTGIVLWVDCGWDDLVVGESIAVDGCCLTVLDPQPGWFRCDVSPETLRLTRAGGYRAGARLNLERALKLSDRIGGHLVSGHVDERCRLKECQARGEYQTYAFEGVTEPHQRYLIKKGSVAVNGVSLTLNAVRKGEFEVMLIPHTLQRTNLSLLSAGDWVNVEFDWMTKVILNDIDNFLEKVRAP